MREVQEETGIKIKTLADEPTLDRHLYWVWQAFSDLNYRRGISMAGGPVPLTYPEIESYCRLKGIYSLGERERLMRLLDVLDREHMAASYDERAANKADTGKSTNITPPAGPSPGARRPPRKRVT